MATRMASGFLAAACIIAIDVAPARSAQHRLLSEIERAWQDRQDRFQSFVVEWEELRTTPAGQHYRGYPPEDVTHVIRRRLAGDGARLRDTRSGPVYDLDLRKFAEKEYTFVFDNSESRTMHTGEKHRAHPPGFISHGNTFPANNYHVQAVIIGFRPLVTALSGIDFSACELSDQPAVVTGVPCRVLKARPKPRVEESFWVAADGDWRIVRHERAVNHRVFSQLTIEYEHRGEHGNVPRAWKHASFNERSGDLTETIVSNVTRIKINAPLPDEEFELEFPGAVVQGPEKNTIAVVRTDGTLRPITQGELAMGIGYDKLMDTEPPPEAFHTVAASRSDRWIIGLAAVLAGAALWLYFRGRSGVPTVSKPRR